MDIEELNTFQIILLVLLVSFVTSIATGIVTVTLLQQAPPAVTETINHVVERTIQTVIPSATSTKPTTVTTQTVVVNQDDLITSSIASALSKTGRVFAGTATTSPVVGLAAEISKNVLVTDASVVSKEHLVSIGSVSALFQVSRVFPDIGIAILTPVATSTVLGDAFKIGDTGAVKLGSTVTAILSVTNARVGIGSVSVVFALADPVRGIGTNLDPGAITGAPLINIFGDLVGISTLDSQIAGGKGAFVSASDILALLNTKATTTPSH